MVRARLRIRTYAMLCVYATWGICTWMARRFEPLPLSTPALALAARSQRLLSRRAAPQIFVYGRLIYTLMGEKSEASFVQSWGVAMGIENATGFKEVLTGALQAAVIAMLLEPFLARGPARPARPVSRATRPCLRRCGA